MSSSEVLHTLIHRESTVLTTITSDTYTIRNDELEDSEWMVQSDSAARAYKTSISLFSFG